MVLSDLGITVRLYLIKVYVRLLKNVLGQRIDYILCSSEMGTWFREANIQEGLMVCVALLISKYSPGLTFAQGSDHCPVYGVVGEKVIVEGCEKHVLDIVNPPGLFIDGKRQSSRALPSLGLSVKMSGEYAGRQSIRDMFLKASAQPSTPSSTRHVFGNGSQSPRSFANQDTAVADSPSAGDGLKSSPSPAHTVYDSTSRSNSWSVTPPSSLQLLEPSAKRQKRTGSSVKKSSDTTRPLCGQQSLTTFFKKPLPTPGKSRPSPAERSLGQHNAQSHCEDSNEFSQQGLVSSTPDESLYANDEILPQTDDIIACQSHKGGSFPSVDPVASKEEWSQLFTKPVAPRCEAHDEPCIKRITKKHGANVGRAFWMCSRLVFTLKNLVIIADFDCFP